MGLVDKLRGYVPVMCEICRRWMWRKDASEEKNFVGVALVVCKKCWKEYFG